MNVRHFVLTRFNLRAETLMRYGRWPGADSDYLSRRFELFERFCLPGLARQSVPFRWLVFFSKLTPVEFRRRITSWTRRFSFLEAVFVDDEEPLDGERKHEAVMSAVRDRLDPSVDYYITTRIDNDDAFNVHALEWIRACAMRAIAGSAPPRFFVVLPRGNAYLVREGFTQEYHWRLNHFPSLICRWGIYEHVLSVEHTKIHKLGLPIFEDNHLHAWLEVVNGMNLKNDFRVHCRPQYLSCRVLRRQFAVEGTLTYWTYLRFYVGSYLPGKIRALWGKCGRGFHA